MQFNLPSNVRQEVIQYDPTLKKIEAETNKSSRKKPAYPLGNVISLGLIPEDVIRLSEQQQAIDLINALPAKDKVHRFTIPVGAAPATIETLAVIYYYKQFWVATWMPRNKDEGYWYGISVAFKDNATARKQFAGRLFRHPSKYSSEHALIPDISHMRSVRIGRTDWCVTSQFITQDQIDDGYTSAYFYDVDGNHQLVSYKERTQLLNESVKLFQASLHKRIPSWTNTRYNNSLWSRATDYGNSIAYCLHQMNHHHVIGSRADHITEYGFVHEPHWYLERFKKHRNFKYIPIELLESRWFRQKVNMMCTKTSAAFNSADLYEASIRPICQPLAELLTFMETTNKLFKLFPDMNLDLVKSRYELLCSVDFAHAEHSYATAWIQDNVSNESFINMLSKYVEHREEVVKERSGLYSRNYDQDEWSGLNRYFWRDLDDIISMTDQIIMYNSQKKDEPGFKPLSLQPKRWRFQEWHDHLMAETWKIQNPNVSLPQKLFPEPIKADGHTFFQPIDTHQLAHWGRAVHNCVGGSSYMEGIKKFKFMIVLCMIKGTPRYTIQLKVDTGVMHVEQIADVSNKRLNDEERSAVQQAFADALQQRNSQLG